MDWRIACLKFCDFYVFVRPLPCVWRISIWLVGLEELANQFGFVFEFFGLVAPVLPDGFGAIFIFGQQPWSLRGGMQNNENRGGKVCRQTCDQTRKRVHSADRSANDNEVMAECVKFSAQLPSGSDCGGLTTPFASI